MLQRVIKRAIEEAYHQQFLWVVLAVFETEILVAHDYLLGVSVLLILEYVLLVVKVDAWANFLHVLGAQLHCVSNQFDLAPVHVEVDFVEEEISLLLHQHCCFRRQSR